MVGGDEADFAEALPLFQCMGKATTIWGLRDAGSTPRPAIKFVWRELPAAYTEAIAYARKSGLDPAAMLSAISGGAAGSWQISNMAPRVLKGDFAPGFFIKHFVKDMKIIKEECDARGIELEMLDSVLHLYEKMIELGHGEQGTQALIEYYEKQI